MDLFKHILKTYLIVTGLCLITVALAIVGVMVIVWSIPPEEVFMPMVRFAFFMGFLIATVINLSTIHDILRKGK